MGAKADAWIASALRSPRQAGHCHYRRASYGERCSARNHSSGFEAGEAKAMNDYVVILEPAPDGSWGAYVPDLPGCTSGGVSREDAARNIRNAIMQHIRLLHEMGRPVPQPVSAAEVVHVG